MTKKCLGVRVYRLYSTGSMSYNLVVNGVDGLLVPWRRRGVELLLRGVDVEPAPHPQTVLLLLLKQEAGSYSHMLLD